MASQDARQDRNRFPTLIVVAGTSGTAADGSEDIVYARGNATTGAIYTEALGASAADPASGTLNTLGTVGSVAAIGQVHNAGTLAAGDNNIGNVDVVTGTVTSVTTVSNLTNGTVRVSVGTVVVNNSTGASSVFIQGAAAEAAAPAGNPVTISAVALNASPTYSDTTVAYINTDLNANLRTLMSKGTLTQGSLTNIGQVHNAGTLAAGDNNIGNVDIVTGTIQSAGTVTGVGVVSNLTNGSINILTGTTTLVSTVTTVSNLTNGSVRMTVGTLTTGTLQNLVSGTINALAAGTITNGTVQVIGQRHADEFATVVVSGTSDLGTIKAAVSGSAIYVTSLVISAATATNVEIASGGTSTRIAGTFFFATNGGLSAQFDPPIRTASGSALVYKQSANNGLSITATGYVD